MIVAIIALIFLFIFMSYPWYFVSYSGDFEEPDISLELSLEYKLQDVKMDFKHSIYENDSTTEKYDDEMFNGSADEVKEVMDNTNLIILISMIIIIIAIIIIPIAAIGKIPHFSGMIFLILGIIFLLIIPLYFFFTFPMGLETHLDKTSRLIGPPVWAPLNETLKYNGDFMSSGSGHEFYDIDYDSDDNRYDYEVKWEPGLAFWLMFVPLIMMVIAQIAYGSGKQDLKPELSRDRGSRPPPPPPPPRDRERGRQVRDYGPPRPMRDEDYDHIPASRPPPRGDYGYREPPPPPRRGGYDYEYNDGYREPPPTRRGGYEQEYDYGRPPPRPPRRREYY
jgi:hypothetical protein